MPLGYAQESGQVNSPGPGFAGSRRRRNDFRIGVPPAETMQGQASTGMTSGKSPRKTPLQRHLKSVARGMHCLFLIKYRSACLDSRFRPATRPLRRVKRNSLLPPPENPRAAPSICRLSLKEGVMVEGATPADRPSPHPSAVCLSAGQAGCLMLSGELSAHPGFQNCQTLRRSNVPEKAFVTRFSDD